MKFKPGDVIVHLNNKKIFYTFLILKVDFKRKIYKTFILNHYKKDWIGQKYTLNFENLEFDTLLQDVDLK